MGRHMGQQSKNKFQKKSFSRLRRNTATDRHNTEIIRHKRQEERLESVKERGIGEKQGVEGSNQE